MSNTDTRTPLEVARDQAEEHWFRIQGLEEELADKRKEIKALERKLSKFETGGVKADAVERLFRFWVSAAGKNPKRTVLTPDRRKAITTAIKQRTEPVCQKIIAQGCKTPYLVYGNWKAKGSPDSLRNDITDFLGKGKYTEQLLEMAENQPEPVVTEEQIASWHDRLFSNEAVCQQLFDLRGWTSETLESLNVGFDGERLVFAVRGATGELEGVVRYLPERKNGAVKSIAAGARGLFPPPESIEGPTIWLVEGEPDAITAHEMWLPGVAVPGAGIGPGEWMGRLVGRKVVICFDCDKAGRDAAKRLARPLAHHAAEVRVIDIEPNRDDGYDLSDWFHSGRQKRTLEAMARLAEPVEANLARPLPLSAPSTNAFDAFVRALEARDANPRELRNGQWLALCPAHDDKRPTLYFKPGDRTSVVTDCKAGCSWAAISAALDNPTHRKAA